MGISLAKITDFFGLADDDMYEEAATPAPKKQVSRPVSAPFERKNAWQHVPTYQSRNVHPERQKKNTAGRVSNQVAELRTIAEG